MPVVIENKEIHRSILSFDEIFNQRFYESHNARTFSSIDSYSDEVLCLNFKKKLKFKSSNSKVLSNYESNENLSNQSELLKIDLPTYFSVNKLKLSELYEEIKSKKDISELMNESFNLLCDSISEIDFSDVHLEITKSNLIKITTLIGNDKILIVSKDVSKNDANIFYSYFIHKQLIASDVSEIKSFTNKFNQYLSL